MVKKTFAFNITETEVDSIIWKLWFLNLWLGGLFLLFVLKCFIVFLLIWYLDTVYSGFLKELCCWQDLLALWVTLNHLGINALTIWFLVRYLIFLWLHVAWKSLLSIQMRHFLEQAWEFGAVFATIMFFLVFVWVEGHIIIN